MTPPAVPSTVDVEPTPMSPPTRKSRPTPRRRRVVTLIYWVAVLTLVGVNVWIYLRDAREVPATAIIEGWIRQGRYEDAHAELAERLRRHPHDVEAMVLDARALAGKGEYLACADRLHATPDWWPAKRELLLREGEAYLELGLAVKAEKAWLAAVKDDPLHPLPPNLLADAVISSMLNIYTIEERFEDAHNMIWEAYKQSPGPDRARLLEMRIHGELERPAPAATLPRLRQFVSADPDDWEAARALARAEYSAGNYAFAATLLAERLKERPDEPRLWHDWLWLLHQSGDKAELLAAAESAPAAAESLADVWNYRGQARLNRGEFDAAGDAFRRAIEIEPNTPEYHYRLAMLARRLGRTAEAAEHAAIRKRLDESRAKLRTTFGEYESALLDAPGAPKLENVVLDLANICRDLGFKRTAAAWLSLKPNDFRAGR